MNKNNEKQKIKTAKGIKTFMSVVYCQNPYQNKHK